MNLSGDTFKKLPTFSTVRISGVCTSSNGSFFSSRFLYICIGILMNGKIVIRGASQIMITCIMMIANVSVLIVLKRIDMDNRKVILDVLGNFCQKGKDDLGRDMMYIKMENAGDLADSLVLKLAKHNVMLNDSKKGTLHILHEAERDIHPEQEKALAKLTNEDLLKIAEDYKNKD